MKRAQLYLWSVLHSVEHMDSGVLSDLADRADRAAGSLPMADPELRRSDMLAAVGVWADRSDLADTFTYIANLRDKDREHKLVPA